MSRYSAGMNIVNILVIFLQVHNFNVPSIWILETEYLGFWSQLGKSSKNSIRKKRTVIVAAGIRSGFSSLHSLDHKRLFKIA